MLMRTVLGEDPNLPNPTEIRTLCPSLPRSGFLEHLLLTQDQSVLSMRNFLSSPPTRGSVCVSVRCCERNFQSHDLPTCPPCQT